MEQREISRAKMRKRRSEARDEEAQRLRAARVIVAATVDRLYDVMTDSDFLEFLRLEGVKTIPAVIHNKAEPRVDKDDCNDALFENTALTFLAAWSFFHPLFERTAIKNFIDFRWPELSSALKDAFILLVLNGPFPQECCGIGRPVRTLFPSQRAKILEASAKALLR